MIMVHKNRYILLCNLTAHKNLKKWTYFLLYTAKVPKYRPPAI